MPPFIVAMLASKPARYAVAVGAALIALAVAVARIFSAGKKAQRAADAKVTTDILEKQRDIANEPPVGSRAIRERMRDGRL